MMKHSQAIFLSLLMILLMACGDNGQSTNLVSEPTLNPDNSRGGFQNISTPIRHSKALIQEAIDAELGASHNTFAKYDVEIRKLEYLSPDKSGMLQKASAVIALPVKTTASPLLSYQHATIFKNAEAPSSVMNDPGNSIETILASQGLIVVSADYIGYGSTQGQSHPYLLREPSANVVIDLIQAAKDWLVFAEIAMSDDLLMTGYSQGAYVTMAALQKIESVIDDLSVSAVSMGGGPYDLTTTFDELLRGLNVPSFLQDFVVDILGDNIIPSNADVAIDRTFLQRFFDGDTQDNVHNWLPNIPVKLFHGQDDEAVPIEAAYSAQTAMQTLGADVELILCTQSPAKHRECVPEYIEYTFEYFAPYIQD